MKSFLLWHGLLVLCQLFLFRNSALHAEDWPTYMHDGQRSGITSESLVVPLYLQWHYTSAYRPQSAWPEPAKTDYWHRETNIKPRVIYDRAYHIVTAGNRIYFASSSDDKVYCLDAETGDEQWSFYCQGPVRLAPTIWQNLVLVGSDDGNVYCLSSENGNLKWQIDTAPNGRMIIGNERMISISPVRTGVLVYDGIAYFAAGLFPNEGVSLYAVDAATGDIKWQETNLDLSPQGYLLASHDKLYIPTGRTIPHVFDRRTGEKIGVLEGEHGGSYALLGANAFVYGGGDLGNLEYQSNEQLATFNGLQMIITENFSYLRTDQGISAIFRKNYIRDYKKWEEIVEQRSELTDELWDLRERRKLVSPQNLPKIDSKIDLLLEKIDKVTTEQERIEASSLVWDLRFTNSYSMILAGNSLIVGGDGTVQIIDATSGKMIWNKEVNGKVYSLAYGNDRLYVSTDNGNIYCFSGKENREPNYVKPEQNQDPYPSSWFFDDYADMADKIIEKTNIKQGYCLIFNAEEGRLPYQLARRTDMQIVAIEDEVEKVAKARENLYKAGLYGTRITIHQGALHKLPYTKQFANLVVFGTPEEVDKIDTPVDEILRVLRPYGGVAYIGSEKMQADVIAKWINTVSTSGWEIEQEGGWALMKKESDRGAGEWTHLYANPANTASSMDQIQAPLQIQWFGRPGPRKMINRHSRPMSTLSKEGRLFIPADERVIVVDAFNGTKLWEQELAHSRILGALKDFGHMVVTDDLLYVAVEDECRGLDVKDGAQRLEFKLPQLINGMEHNWGYLAVTGNQLFGSGKKKSASFTILGRFNCDDFEGDFREMVLSDYLFSMNRESGEIYWTYRKGVVFNNTIAIGDDHVYFVESRNDKAVSDSDGRLRVDYFCQEETYLIKMNKLNGEIIWQKAVQFPFQHIMYLSYAEDIILVTGSYNKGKYVHYGLYAFDARSGDKVWDASFRGGNTRWQTDSNDATIDGTHGEQWQHPVIIKDIIYLPPHNFDLHNGRQGDIYLTRGGHGCGGLSGSAHNLFARGSNPRIYDLGDGPQSGKPLTTVNRPGCWINIIPAAGLVSIPESSSGCTCAYAIQTSFVFVPTER